MAKETDGGFEQILALLHRHTGVDFTSYKSATLQRRIERRMNAYKIRSFKEYGKYLRLHENELKELFNDILIQVTSFFRDVHVFKTLRTKYFPQMLRAKGGDDPIRIWVPACSTGEELYSLAILLAEITEAKKDTREIQIFGTDVNEVVLKKARAGFYSASIRAHVSLDQLHRFFEPAKGGFVVRKHIRDLCIFARHNLAIDPPFSNLDFISCRNALIYMAPILQARIIASFHFGLRPGGLLLLGPSETPGHSADLFLAEDRKLNLFSKNGGAVKNLPDAFSLPSPALSRPTHITTRQAAASHLKKLDPAQVRAAVEKIIQRTPQAEDMDSEVVPITLPKTGDKAYLVLGAVKKTGKSKKTTDKNSEAENAKLRKELFRVSSLPGRRRRLSVGISNWSWKQSSVPSD